MPLQPGLRLGPYEIQSALGAGGMGEVYRARDTRLDRTVAIKVLPAQLRDDPEFRERFDREARAISALDHPHICALYDVGEHDGMAYLVMEYLEGETLARRLEHGRAAARRGADDRHPDRRRARQGASRRHRPSRPEARQRDADEGRAPSCSTSDWRSTGVGRCSGAGSGPTASPTMTRAADRRRGPSSARFSTWRPSSSKAQEADARTDIFAFGAVLYEMLTGKKAFEGKSQASLIGAILEREPPPVASLQPATPASLDHVVRTCLAKDPENRFHSAHDLLVQLKWIRDQGSQAAPAVAPVPRGRSRNRLLAAAFVTLLVATVTGFAVWRLKPEPSRPIRRFAIVLPGGDQFSGILRHLLAISPDGTRLAYVANERLYLRMMDQVDATPIPGTEEGGATNHARNPFFSPDGQWIGFWQGGQLKKVSVSGGAPVVLCAAENPWGASWGADGTILFGQGPKGISQVSDSGGPASALVSIDSKTEAAHGPQMLPGGEAVLFTLRSSAAQSNQDTTSWDNAQILVQSLDSGRRTVVVQGGTDARYVSTGHLIYVRAGTLLAVPFDPVRLVTTGNPTPVADGIRQADATVAGVPGGGGAAGAAQFAVSQDGLFAYIPRDTATGGVRGLTWVDRQGRETSLPVPDRAYSYPRISPDGTRIALDIRDQEQDIWVWDLGRETLTRLTFDPAPEVFPLWTPDGKRIVSQSQTGPLLARGRWNRSSRASY